MRAKRTDATQAECIRAIRLLGLKYKDLSKAGDGIEDLLVLIPARVQPPTPWNPLSFRHLPYWLFVECKTIRTVSTGRVVYKPAQKKWRAETPDGPRITVTSFEDTLRQLRELCSTERTFASVTA